MAGQLCQIKPQTYPSSDVERDDAIQRPRGFLFERNYAAANQNCQHFVNEVLMGESRSTDTECSEKMRILGCLVDSLSLMAGRFVYSIVRVVDYNTKFAAIGDDMWGLWSCRLEGINITPQLPTAASVLENGSFALLC